MNTHTMLKAIESSDHAAVKEYISSGRHVSDDEMRAANSVLSRAWARSSDDQERAQLVRDSLAQARAEQAALAHTQ